MALVEHIARGEPAARLRAQVAQWHPEATLDQVEDAFQEACLLAVGRARGRSEGEVFTWIRTTTTHKVSEIVAAARREQLAAASAIELRQLRADSVEGPEDELIEREDQADLEQFMAVVLERLSDRQRDVAALHTRGRNRPQIAEHLRLTQRTVKRELERILALGRTELARFAGHGCAEGEELVRRFAFGLASSSRELSEAQLHLATCPRCTAFYERLDAWHQKAATVLPLPAAEQLDPGIVERTIHAGGEAVAGLKQQIGEGGAQLKQHAASTYYRAADPTPISGLRPGAAATAIAGCLALGGGATYCAQQGVDPLGELKGIVEPKPERQAQEPPKQRSATEQPPPESLTPPPGPAAPAPQPPPVAAAAPPATPPQVAPPPPPPPEQEFEPTSPASSSSSAPTTSPQPAPAPAGGVGEFGP